MTIFDVPTLRPVTVCGRTLPNAAHICAFFESDKQELDCLVPYYAEGLAQGEQVVAIREAEKCSTHLARLRELMPQSLDAQIRTNQLLVMSSEETYLSDGCFAADRMFCMVKDLLQDAERGPYTRVRTCGDMTWALHDMPGTGELMEYESRLNQLTTEHDCTLMCAYDVNKFSGRAVMDVLATHPMVLMGNQIYENPYYVEPRAYLQTLFKRGAAPLARPTVAA